MPKVSVIIPVFNAQEYLAKCLDSIVNQTLKDIEIVCVNDGSVDSSLKILEGYAQNDSRIVVVSQNNKGQGAARNKGIKIANGEYIAFVDNDDHIDLNFLEAAYKNAKENNADIVFIGNKRHVYENSSRSIMYEATQSFDLLKCKYEMMNEWVAPWCKLYRTNFIRSKNILFSGGKGEDLPFAIYCCLHTDKISLCNDFCYYYSVRANSECRRKPVRKDFVEITQFKKIFKELRLFKLSRKDYTFYKKAIIRRMMTSFDILYSGSSFVNKIFLILLLSTHFPLIFLNYCIFPKIFSIKNSYDKQHKVIYLLGIKVKIRKKIKIKYPKQAKNIEYVFNDKLNGNKLAAVAAMHNQNATLDENFIEYLSEIRKHVGFLIIAADHPILVNELEKIKNIADAVIFKKHNEYDFGSYKRGYCLLKKLNLLEQLTNLVCLNDSVIYVGKSLEQQFQQLSQKDFYGITQNSYGFAKPDKGSQKYRWVYSPHIQSYFFSLSSKIFNQKWFYTFIKNIKHQKNKEDIIIAYEMGLSKLILEHGYTLNSFYPFLKEDANIYKLYLNTENPEFFIKKCLLKR